MKDKRTKIILAVVIAALAVVLVVVLVNYYSRQGAPAEAVAVQPEVVSATMTTGIDNQGAPEDSVTQYAPEDTLIASCTLNEKTTQVSVKFVWSMENKEFKTETVESENGYASSEVRSQHTWNPGNYEVSIYLDGGASPGATLQFTVAAPAPVAPEVTAATMTTGIDAKGAPTTSVTQYNADDELIASCTLNTNDAVPVKFVWSADGKEFKTESANSKGGYASDVLKNSQPWTAGNYQVDIYLEGSAAPDATLQFTVVAGEQPTASPTATPTATASASASAGA